MELNKEQLKAVTTTANKVVVIAAPAVGKTRVLTERIKWLLDNGVDPYKIVAITFTNAAAEEMKARLGEKAARVFIGTVHSYANYLLRSDGRSTTKMLDNEDFDGLLEEVETYPSCIQEVEHLLLDEAQDSSELQFSFIFDMVQPKNYFIVGDHRQSIYAFSGGRSDIFYGLTQKEGVTVYHLNENYRNGENISFFAKQLISKLGAMYYDFSTTHRSAGSVMEGTYEKNKIGNMIKLNVKNGGKYSDWFILTRTNSQIDLLQRHLNEMNIPNETFKRSELDLEGFNAKMANNTVKVMTMHSSKGLEAKNVIVYGQRYNNADEIKLDYVAATRAENFLYWCSKLNYKPKKKKEIHTW